MMTAQPIRRRRTRQGLSLLEVLIALTILLVGVTVGVMGTRAATRTFSHQKHLTEAMSLCEARLEDFLLLYPDSADLQVGAHGPEHYNRQGHETGSADVYSLTWNVTSHATLAEMVNIKVQVTWNDDKGLSRFIFLETMREGGL